MPLGIRAALQFAVEVEVPEPGDRTQDQPSGGARLDLFEVTVVAERLDGVADRRVDRPVGSLGHRVGDLESFEEKRGNLDGAARVGVEVRQL
jgi:hypothetical protein